MLMKKKIFILLSAALLFTLTLALAIFVGCSNPTEQPSNQPTSQPEKLQAPKNLLAERRLVTWDPVENASGYTVIFQNTEYKIDECSFDLNFYDIPGAYTVEVMARGDGKAYEDSEWINTTAVIYEKVEQGYDELGFEYKLLEDGTGYSVSRGKADIKGDIVIPDYFNDFPVKEIAHNAFCFGFDDDFNAIENTQTTGITLPRHLEQIGSSAFADLVALEEIVIPDGITRIPYQAFKGCKSLKKAVLPNGLKEISFEAFAETALEEISLPDSLESIGQAAFRNGFPVRLYKKNELGEMVLFYEKHVYSNLSSIVIPESVTYIGDEAFFGRENLNSIKFEALDKVEYIGKDWFEETKWWLDLPDGPVCYENILFEYKGRMPVDFVFEIPDGITYIAPFAFYEKDTLKKVIIPKSVTHISDDAFRLCTALTEAVFLGDGLEYIGARAFANASSLQSIELPSTVTSIGSSAFSHTGLTSIKIPEKIKEIPYYAFVGCANLTEIIFSENSENLEDFAHVSIAACVSLKNITVPKGTLFLGNILQSCSSLEWVIIPNSVKKIGSSILVGSNNAHIYFEGDTSQWNGILSESCYSFTDSEKTKAEKNWEKLTVYFYSEEEPAEEGNFWHYVDGKPTPWN